jgi:hypothetical protein
MLSGISEIGQDEKSVALSRELVSITAGAAAAELTASTGADGIAGEVAAGSGVVEAKRTPAPLRIKRFVLGK